ncbi:MAG TPA: carboxypeptidase-like regulatory domain-containing protein [Thermodesulfobacteriota bacterium]|nr:carboxypeptidase-like regulatory domain-containing protein [Thermodesulfobacteriota bacterium]
MIPLFILGMMLYIFLIYSAEENFSKREKTKNITFLSGGVSEPERKNLEEMGRNYSLKVIFSNESGEYPSEVTVTIFGQEGESILTTVSNGPWFFINLPSGTYDLEVSFQKNRKRISEVIIEEKSQTVIGVRW